MIRLRVKARRHPYDFKARVTVNNTIVEANVEGGVGEILIHGELERPIIERRVLAFFQVDELVCSGDPATCDLGDDCEGCGEADCAECGEDCRCAADEEEDGEGLSAQSVPPEADPGEDPLPDLSAQSVPPEADPGEDPLPDLSAQSIPPEADPGEDPLPDLSQGSAAVEASVEVEGNSYTAAQVQADYDELGTWSAVAERYDISTTTLYKLRKDLGLA